MPKQRLNPPALPNWSESFSQVVVSTTGSSRTIHISGQVSVDERNQIVGPGDLARQAEKAFANLAAALRAANATPADVVRLGIYIVDYRRDQAVVIQRALRTLFAGDQLPASTWLGVTSLALEGLLIEVEATAIVES
jgi:enamine deaminase RidA (YjgF/YER057c/UK114 family)